MERLERAELESASGDALLALVRDRVVRLWGSGADDYEYARSLNLPRGFQLSWASDLVEVDIKKERS